MNSLFKKILLFIVVLVLSYFAASPVGTWYDTISPQHGGWMVGGNQAVFFAGMVVSYIFFIPFIYGLFGIKRNKNWIIWSILPAVLLMFGADKYHFYIPVLLIIGALALVWLIRFIISKFRRPNPPMVVK